MSIDRQQLETAIAALEAQRALLGDVVVDTSVAGLRARLEALTAASAAESAQRLRQVSILFLDVVGSTALSQHLDPEGISGVMDGALARATAIVRSHQGKVLQYAGDSLLAAFGADGSTEDEAERAVRCGLALLELGRVLGAEVQAAHGRAGCDVRVGIHTGGVLLGGGVDADGTIRGLAVNIAARMEQTAPPGTLRISMDTYRLVQGGFDVLEQPAMQVKGLQAPMRTFLVQGVRERRLRGLRHGADGVSTAMVGRDDELRRLQHLVQAVFAPGGGLGAATVLGDAGLGKSRLLAEFQAGLAADPQAHALWRATSHPQGLYQPYGLLRDLLFWHLGVRDSDSQAQAQQTIAAALAPVFGAAADEQTALLGQLLGLDCSASPHIAGILRDGKQLQARGLNAWIRYLRLQAMGHPLVLVLDDLQWADDASLDALDLVAAMAPELPILLLCSARPELLQRRPQWAAAWPRHALLALSPLPPHGSGELAGSLLARFATPVPALAALLATQSAGNPYYMEALLQMLVDTGVILTTGAHWQVEQDRLQGLKVPATLVGVLQATLDALDADELRSLQQASVVGAQFWDEALAAIDPHAPDKLPALARRELALPHAGSAFEGTREYGFRHHLLHQVTYGTVLKPDRRTAHGHAAQWLQARSQGRENELAGQIAEHFERAGDKAQAIAYWLRSAEDAARRQADSAALAHADRGLALLDGADLERLVRLHGVRKMVFRRAGKSIEHGREVAILESLADRLGSDALRLELAYDLAWRLFQDARYEEAVELAEARLAQAQSPSPTDAANVHSVISICLSRLGRHDEAMAHAERGLAQCRAAGDLRVEGQILNHIGLHHMDAERLPQALETYGQAMGVYRAAGDRNGVITVRMNLAVVEEMLCRFASARALLEQVIAECRDTGALRLEALASANVSALMVELGDSELAYETALEGLRLARVSGERRVEAFSHRGARMAALALGRWPAVLEHARAGRAGFTDSGHLDHACLEASMVARSLLALDEPAQALAEAEALMSDVARRGGWGDAFEAPFHLHAVMAALGDERAGGLLRAAHEYLSAQAGRLAELVPRDSYVHATIAGRAIARAWAERQPGGDARAS